MEGIGGGQQVGSGQTSSSTHALLWAGTAASAVDLNPASALSSEAIATSGVHQVGYAEGIYTPVKRVMPPNGPGPLRLP